MVVAVSASATLILLHFRLASKHWLLLCTVPVVPRRRARALLVGGCNRHSAMAAPALAFLPLHAVESNLVSPWVAGRQLQPSPLAVFLLVMFCGWLWGIAGAVIAVPMLIGIRSLCRRQRALRQVCHYLGGNWRPPPSLARLLRGVASANLIEGSAAPVAAGPVIPVGVGVVGVGVSFVGVGVGAGEGILGVVWVLGVVGVVDRRVDRCRVHVAG